MSLPVMDGWEATRRFKIDEKHRAIPIIALIAHDMRDAEEKARGFGCVLVGQDVALVANVETRSG